MPARGKSHGAYAAALTAVVLAYYATAKLGLTLAHDNAGITAIWAPTGIALAALVLGCYRLWPGVALGSFLANSWTGVPLVTVLGTTLGNTLEALAGASLLRAVRFQILKPPTFATRPAPSLRLSDRAPALALRFAPLVAVSTALCALTIGLAGTTSAPSATHVRAVVADVAAGRELVAGLNRLRVRRGLRPLRVSAALAGSATQHSVEMATEGYFDHDSPHGPTFAARLEHHYPERGSDNWWVAENILWIPGTLTAETAPRSFMSSPEHRANILNPGGREVGVSVVHASHAPGVYGGRDVTIVTTDFGAR